jgi:hypothetical protein
MRQSIVAWKCSHQQGLLSQESEKQEAFKSKAVELARRLASMNVQAFGLLTVASAWSAWYSVVRQGEHLLQSTLGKWMVWTNSTKAVFTRWWMCTRIDSWRQAAVGLGATLQTVDEEGNVNRTSENSIRETLTPPRSTVQAASPTSNDSTFRGSSSSSEEPRSVGRLRASFAALSQPNFGASDPRSTGYSSPGSGKNVEISATRRLSDEKWAAMKQAFGGSPNKTADVKQQRFPWPAPSFS